MRNNFNKKKISFISLSKIIKYLIVILIFFVLSFFIYDELFKQKKYKQFIQEFSEKTNYLFISYEINDLRRVHQSEIIKILDKYLGKSIFLIPLKNISNEITDLNWVKSVNLSKDLKSKITVQILEYEPLGLYVFNDKIYYFSKEGRVIEQSLKNDEEFIMFSGKNVLSHAVEFLNIIRSIQSSKLNNIEEAKFINDRRWNLKLSNQILVLLSEKNIKSSLKNYIKLINQLKESEILLIKSIDLRNQKKAIINFK